MGIPIKIQVLGRDLLAIAIIGPALVVSDSPLRNTVPSAAGPVDASTAAILSITRSVNGVSLISPDTELRSGATISKLRTADVQGAFLGVGWSVWPTLSFGIAVVLAAITTKVFRISA